MKHPSPLTVWETATDVGRESQPGLLPQHAATPLTALLALAIAIFLWPVMGAPALPLGLLFARLMALDLTTYTLPNIYTLPMLAVGGVYAASHGLLTQGLLAALLLLCLAWLLGRLSAHVGMGGGDLKLLLALFTFMPAASALFALGLGCLLWMPVAVARPRRAVPFGIPILLGWVVMLRFPTLPNLVFSTIS